MKFKTFKAKKPTRSFMEGAPKIKDKHKEFMATFEEQMGEEEYLDWEEKFLFSLFLKPEIELEELTPNKIDQYFKPDHQLIC